MRGIRRKPTEHHDDRSAIAVSLAIAAGSRAQLSDLLPASDGTEARQASADAGPRHARPRRHRGSEQPGLTSLPEPTPADRPRRRGRVLVRAAAMVGMALVLSLSSERAFAYFTSAGQGVADAGTAQLLPLVVQPATTGTLSSTLLPGTTADLIVSVHNPNAFPVTLLSVAQGGGVIVAGGHGCTSDPAWPGTLGNSGVSVTTTTGLSTTVPGQSTVTLHLPSAAVMSTTSASGCQGATFQIPVTVSAGQ